MSNLQGDCLIHQTPRRASRRSARRGRAALWVAAVSCISVSYVPSARALNKTWIGNAGSYATDTNWSPSGVPIFSDTIEFGPLHPGALTFPPLTSFAVGGFVEKSGGYVELHLNGGTLNVNGTVSMGQDGFDELIVTGGALVVPANAGSTTVGTNNAGTGELVVSPGALFNSSQQIAVGRSGAGIFILEGQAFNSSASIGQFGPPGKGNGSAFVEGIGASWTVANTLMVGGMDVSNPLLGFGTLAISPGASVSAAFLQITGNAHGRVDIIGGALSVGSINLLPTGILNFSSGTLSMTGKDGLFIGDTGLLGSNISLGSGKNLLLTGNSLSYAASPSTMNVNGGMLSIPIGGFENAGQMVVSGNSSNVSIGTFQNDFGGNLLVQDAGPKFTLAFSNTGEIVLSGSQARMTIPDANVSVGQNDGLITGNGLIDGDFTNMAEGEVRVGSGQRIIVFPSVPFSNSGSITLSGDGMFEVQGMLNNAGYITGRGTLYSHGITSNSGTMSFSGGLTDVRGSINNTNRITITGGSTTTFYNAVTNTGNIRIDPGSSAVFLGNVSVGSVTGGGTAYYDGDAVGGPIVNTGASVVDASLLVDYIRQNSLTISGAASIRPNGASDHFTRLNTLSIPGGSLDLADNDAIIDSTTPTAVQSLIRSGYAGGAWNGPGITSSLAHGGPGATALGYASAASINRSAFDGQSVSGSSVLIAYTLNGDENLDGAVNALDFNALATNFGQQNGSSMWFQGDFNYDGNVNTLDFNSLAANFGRTLPATSVSLAPAISQILLPEPTVGLLCLPLLVSLSRWRRFNARSALARLT